MSDVKIDKFLATLALLGQAFIPFSSDGKRLFGIDHKGNLLVVRFR